jgi:hypothetical protein
MRSTFGVAIVLAALAGCSGAPQIIYVTPEPTPTASGSLGSATPAAQAPTPATPPPTATPTPTATPRTTRRPTPSPAEAELERGRLELIAWKPRYSDYVYYLVIQEVSNVGDGWAEMAAFDSSFEIFDADGAVVTTGNFLYAYPVALGPGQTGYLIEQGVEEGFRVDDFHSVTFDGRYRDLARPPDQALEVSNITLRRADYDDGLYVTGQAQNTGTEDIDSAHVAAIFFDDQGNIIGASTTNLLEHIDAGQTKAFETIGSNPLRPSDVADYVVIASSGDF